MGQMTEKISEIKSCVTRLLDWYRRNARDLPWRRDITPYRVWVSEIMLQQTRVEAVRPYYERFLKELPTIRDLAGADDRVLMKLWEGLGYYSRVRNMQKAARDICERFGGQMPGNYEDIRSLCGIGDYTAGAIASFAFGLPYPAVDGNVLRVMARLTGNGGDILNPSVRKQLTAAVEDILPNDVPAEFNQAMIEIGATVCKPNGVAGGPVCKGCPFETACQAHRMGRETELPVRVVKTRRREEDRTVFKLWSGDRCAVCRRPERGLLSGLYEFPNVKGHLSMEEALNTVRKMGFEPLQILPMARAEHVFSHLVWHLIGWSVRIGDVEPDETLPYQFFLQSDIKKRIPIPAAFAAYAGQNSWTDGTEPQERVMTGAGPADQQNGKTK